MTSLRGRVAVVAGATRGAGRGIACALGEAGATVVCTGRSSRVRAGQSSEYAGRPETIEETAELVTKLGGRGIAKVVDHLDPAQVARLASELRTEVGQIDVLVNDIWGAELLKGMPPDWNKPIWEVDLEKGLRTLRLAIDTHLITSHHLLPLLIGRPTPDAGGEAAQRPGGRMPDSPRGPPTIGLHVEIGDGTSAYNATNYRISAFYDLAKVAVNRLGFSMGHELKAHGCTAVSLTPGWMRSELMLEAFGVKEENWRDALSGGRAPPGFAQSETPRFVGRAVAALAADEKRARWNQQSLTTGQLAREYGFKDLDGTQPDAWAEMG